MSGLNISLMYRIEDKSEVETYNELADKLVDILEQNGMVAYYREGLHDFCNHQFKIAIYSKIRPTRLLTVRKRFGFRREYEEDPEVTPNPEGAFESMTKHLEEFKQAHGKEIYRHIWADER